ncbi:putative domain HDIG-containing protein [Aequorivita sublithincola DSM 14238]|uniref:Putative domain HDIG-containing protein n=1 Tax=Aequorivita sublithincola (strain DSM 14238 / LMG 21431 / ACAM 643 / 9-3) TaxID=746697 RepID=I3YZG7_AEQSU|nr:Pycsar system effector family protein [Aequorivita sublithincola]AFL82385.1 putative domain HDIG-containing protein [Aequorivita sublithincola DSM 14238]
MSDIVEAADKFIFQLFKDKLPNTFIYHNYKHSCRVHKSINEIIENSQIDVKDAKILRLAALLHDTGYTVSRENHEEEGVKIATEFLKEHNVEDDIIEGVKKCILATKFKDTVPNSELEKIIRDADTSHLGKDYFEEASEFLRQELQLQNIQKYTAEEWIDLNIKMLLEEHQFYTDYALKNWLPVKEDNLAKLFKDKKKKKEKIQKERVKAKLKAKYKNDSPERGIQTFYRTALRNHMKLSDIADTKANIMLSVNAIIISLVLSNLISKLDNNNYLIIPTAIFILFSAITMILAVIATRPNVTRGEFTKEDVEKRNVNLTFFGNFHKMELEQFEWAIDELLKDRNYVYKSLTKDLYFLGKVLDRKYRILRLTYTIFVAGTIISLISFAVFFYLEM